MKLKMKYGVPATLLCALALSGCPVEMPPADDAGVPDDSGSGDTGLRRDAGRDTGVRTDTGIASDAGVDAFAADAFMAVCGNGMVEPSETCDDGNATAGDGCDASCAPEAGYDCDLGMPTDCQPTCGDGMRLGAELEAMGCDDGNVDIDDGCNDVCVVEEGSSCMGTPSVCATGCGNGIVFDTEECDDGNMTSGDGCAPSCAIEDGYTCMGAPSACMTECGDGIIAGMETCDDDNAVAMDGCGATCAIEMGYVCSGTPSVCLSTTEREPNEDGMPSTGGSTTNGNDFATENALMNGAITGDFTMTAAFNTAGDEDVFAVTNTAAVPRSFTFLTSDRGSDLTACSDPLDTVVSVRDAAGVRLALNDDVDGVNPCSAVSFEIPAGATVFVHVTEYGDNAAGDYQLSVITCGNGTLSEPYEACDDGNAMNGDGCDNNCTVSACGNGVVAGAETCDDRNAVTTDCCDACANFCTLAEAEPNDMSASATATGPATGGVGAISMAMGADFYSFTLSAASNVRVETFDSTGSACATIDTFVQLRGSDGTTVILSDDDDGLGFCSLLNPTVDTAARGLAAGTYYVRVTGNATSTPAYKLRITTTAAGCGDGFVTAPETCDDANAAGGDGCTACAVDAGYTCAGSPSVCARAPMRSTIAAMCVDMTAGTAVPGVTTDDSVSAAIALPFPIVYFGATMTHFRASSNGFAALFPNATGSLSSSAFNETMPTASTPNAVVAPFWDDLEPPTSGASNVRSLTTGMAGSRVFTLQWTNWRRYDSTTTQTGQSLTFQVQFREGTNVIEYHYCDMTPATAGGDSHTGTSATIGMENATGTVAALQSFNTASAVTTGSGFRFTP